MNSKKCFALVNLNSRRKEFIFSGDEEEFEILRRLFVQWKLSRTIPRPLKVELPKRDYSTMIDPNTRKVFRHNRENARVIGMVNAFNYASYNRLRMSEHILNYFGGFPFIVVPFLGSNEKLGLSIGRRFVPGEFDDVQEDSEIETYSESEEDCDDPASESLIATQPRRGIAFRMEKNIEEYAQGEEAYLDLIEGVYGIPREMLRIIFHAVAAKK